MSLILTGPGVETVTKPLRSAPLGGRVHALWTALRTSDWESIVHHLHPLVGEAIQQQSGPVTEKTVAMVAMTTQTTVIVTMTKEAAKGASGNSYGLSPVVNDL